MSSRRTIRGSFNEVFDGFQEAAQIQPVQVESARCPLTPIEALVAAQTDSPGDHASPPRKRLKAHQLARMINDKLSG